MHGPRCPRLLGFLDLLCYKFQRPNGATDGHFQLMWRRSFKSPLLSVIYLDLTGDGLKELAILTIKGLHILQHSLTSTADLILKRLTRRVEKQAKKDQPIKIHDTERTGKSPNKRQSISSL